MNNTPDSPQPDQIPTFEPIIEGLAKLAADWHPSFDEMYDDLTKFELTPEAFRGGMRKLKEAHQADLQKAVEAFAEGLKEVNGSIIHNCGRRIDHIIYPQIIDEHLAAYLERNKQ